jgi:hypothetical protein
LELIEFLPIEDLDYDEKKKNIQRALLFANTAAFLAIAKESSLK